MKVLIKENIDNKIQEKIKSVIYKSLSCEYMDGGDDEYRNIEFKISPVFGKDITINKKSVEFNLIKLRGKIIYDGDDFQMSSHDLLYYFTKKLSALKFLGINQIKIGFRTSAENTAVLNINYKI